MSEREYDFGILVSHRPDLNRKIEPGEQKNQQVQLPPQLDIEMEEEDDWAMQPVNEFLVDFNR